METFGSSPTPENKAPQRDKDLNPQEGLELAAQLRELLDKYKNKRVLIVAPPGAGKSTLLQHIPEGVDMDNALFDKMPERDKNVALQRTNPYMLLDETSKGYKKTIKYSQKEFVPGDESSEEGLKLSSDFLTTYVNSHLTIEAGKPVFATNVIDCDVLIYLKLNEHTYRGRIESRNIKTARPPQLERNFKIKELIEEDVEEAKRIGIIVEELEINS